MAKIKRGENVQFNGHKKNNASRLAPDPPTRIKSNPAIDLILLALRPKSVSPESETAAWIRRHPVLSLVGIAYGLTWIGLIPLIQNPNLSYKPGQVNLPIAILAFFGVLGCLWAALIVASAQGGATARYALLRGYLHWKVGIQWYLVVLLSPAIIWGAAIGFDYLLSGLLPRVPAFISLPVPLLISYALLLVRYLAGNYEEICCRTSLLPRLQSKYSALAASLMVGVIQGFWHLPYIFVKGSFVQAIGLPAMILLSVAMGIVFTWVYNSTRVSLLLMALFHAAFDVWSPFQGSDVRLAYFMIGVWCLLAVIGVAVFGTKRLSREPVAKEPMALPEPR